MSHFFEDNPVKQTNKFRGKYRIESTRLKNWDYSSEGAYFVTLCTQNREYFFGDIVDGTMNYSRTGEMVAKEWENTKNIRSNVELDKWIVMPNHIHGIVVIKNSNAKTRHVETHCNASLRRKSSSNQFGPQSHNLASIIRGFKGASTKQIHVEGFMTFAWQPRFYDHIIRDENDLNRIREYIINNPIKWNSDRNNLENLYM